MDLRKLKTILDLFENSNIQELELTEDKETIRLSKGPGGVVTSVRPQQSAMAVTTQAPAPSPAAPAPAPAAAPAPEPAEAEDDGLVELKAPMVGTFYSRQSPDDPPFVTIGTQVSEGDPVCLIEAMKMFNTLKAPVSGKVESIKIQNEQPVGYGDVLMTFRPDPS